MWRSLDEKDQSAETRTEQAQSEFGRTTAAGDEMVDASSLTGESSGFGRRGFMTLSGATAAVVGLQACIRRPVEMILPYTDSVEHIVPGVPMHFATVTARRTDALGLVVTSHQGRPTKVEGNPAHPSSRGGTDVWAQASLLDLYDPDRSTIAFSKSVKDLAPTNPALRRASRAQVEQELLSAVAAHKANAGAGLRFLAPPSLSPSWMRVRDQILGFLPKAQFHTHASVHDWNAREGATVAFGQPVHAIARIERAKVILSLDCDFLGTDTGSVASSAAFAHGRRVRSGSDPMNRLYVVEPTLSNTGANADHHLRLPASQVGRYLRAIAQHLKEVHQIDSAGVGPALGKYDPSGIPNEWLTAVTKDLVENRGRSVLMVGARQPGWVHALAHAVNEGLGNTGRTVSYAAVQDSQEEHPEQSLRTLVQDMSKGAVRTLLILGGDPVHDSPADLDMAGALSKVAFSLHLSDRRNGTTAACNAHIPETHELEAWGDLVSRDGTYAVQQPLVEPLFHGMSSLELLNVVRSAKTVADGAISGHDLVQETLKFRMAGRVPNFQRVWRSTLHRGVFRRGRPIQPPTVMTGPVAQAVQTGLAQAAKKLSKDNLEVVFAPCNKLFDGRHANNPWLLELPDNVTKVCWDNVAMISPPTAREFGLSNGDMVEITVGPNAVEVPAWVQPGHADNSVSLSLGWGREGVGRYGKNQGFDVQGLRRNGQMWITTGSLKPKGTRYFIAQTQDHDSMEGRPIAIDATQEQYKNDPIFAKKKSVDMTQVAPPLWKTEDYSKDAIAPFHKWGMTIDLSACTGCNTCVVACQSENNIPSVGKRQIARGREMYWIRIDRYFVGDDENNPQVSVQPVGCQQCEQAPCENVCPVNATVHSPDGLNDMVYNRCIGTRYCANNCPYKVRRFNYRAWHGYLDDPMANYDELPEIRKMQYNPNVTVRMRGVMEKCTYCVQRIRRSHITRENEGREYRDGDVTPACAQACPTRAITFGDLNDSNSRVARSASMDRSYRLLAELGTRPRTIYLGKIRNPNPAMETHASNQASENQA